MLDKIKQYGFYHFLRRAILYCLRLFVFYEKYIVFEMPNFRSRRNLDHELMIFDKEELENLKIKKAISIQDYEKYIRFLSDGDLGVAVLMNGSVAGTGWVRLSGSYEYGCGLSMDIPDHVVVMKNLFVNPEYRGKGIGKVLNKARLSLVAEGVMPIVFIVYDNKVAIRNWLGLGFKSALEVSVYKFFGRYLRIHSCRFSNSEAAIRIEKSLLSGVSK